MEAMEVSRQNGWVVYRLQDGEHIFRYAVADPWGNCFSFHKTLTWAEGWANVHETGDFTPQAGTIKITI